MGDKSDIQASPKSRKNRKNSRTPRRGKSDIQQGGNSIRIIQEQRVRHSCCYNPERRKGIGAVLFTLGIPSLIAGLIMTIVSVTDDGNENKYPRAFIAIGPILLVLAVTFFSAGIFLHSAYARKAFEDCFSLDNPDSFCRVKCPTLSQCLSPNDNVIINQAAIKALQSEPGKSVLKRKRLLSDPAFYGSNIDNVEKEENDVFVDENDGKKCSHSPVKRQPRGVHFSDGDVDQDNRKRTASLASDNGSVLSLKHCKIHPKNDDIWWTDENKKSTIHINNHTEVLRTTEL